MGFVIPKTIAATKAPVPASDQVELTQRPDGQFAAIRFSGRIMMNLRKQQQTILEAWIDKTGRHANVPPNSPATILPGLPAHCVVTKS